MSKNKNKKCRTIDVHYPQSRGLLTHYSYSYSLETMIAAIEWIPAGRANPSPSKYEYSRAEQEFLEKVQNGELGQEETEENEEEWEDVDDDDDNEKEDQPVQVPAVDPTSLPADLRMDDYSDDEDGEDKVGGLLVGKVRFFFLLLWMFLCTLSVSTMMIETLFCKLCLLIRIHLLLFSCFQIEIMVILLLKNLSIIP